MASCVAKRQANAPFFRVARNRMSPIPPCFCGSLPLTLHGAHQSKLLAANESLSVAV